MPGFVRLRESKRQSSSVLRMRERQKMLQEPLEMRQAGL
jgi:hypothetical protein